MYIHLNRVFLSGMVAKGTKTIQGKDGTPICILNIYTTDPGVRYYHTVFFRAKQAEYIAKKAKEGDCVLVEGELRYSDKQTEHGDKYRSYFISGTSCTWLLTMQKAQEYGVQPIQIQEGMNQKPRQAAPQNDFQPQEQQAQIPQSQPQTQPQGMDFGSQRMAQQFAPAPQSQDPDSQIPF